MDALQGSMTTVDGGSDAVAVSRWLTGGIAAANCVGAYEPMDAASLAASYTNLANAALPITPGVAPTWAAGVGWTGNGIDQYLNTNIAPTNDQTTSVIIRYSGATLTRSSVLFGCAAGAAFQLAPNYTGNLVVYSSGASKIVSPGLSAGVLAIAGNKAYRSGNLESGTIPSAAGTFSNFYIFARSDASGTPNTFQIASVQRLYIYNIDISPYIAGLTTAINS